MEVFLHLGIHQLVAPLTPYRKPYQTGLELCDKLSANNLIIDSPAQSALLLERISYYRFKAYLFPFQDDNGRFYDHVNIDDSHQLYCFDEKLRQLVFQQTQYLEIGIRSQFDQWLTTKTNNPFWYLNASLFHYTNGKHIKTVSKVRGMFVDSKEEFAKHFKQKYYNEYCPFYRELPPGWVAIELMSFGNVSSLMSNVTDGTVDDLKLDRFANRKLGVIKYRTLCNWISVIHDVRNYCGHHSRLFNRNLKAPTGIKRVLMRDIQLPKTRTSSGEREEDQLNRIYTALAAMQKILTALGYPKMGPLLNELLEQHPKANSFLASMGFPDDWQSELLFFDRQ